MEKYGSNSKCFDHTNTMWQERNCHQVRQWQHWGSGCYEYECRDGRLHISVDNRTFTCFYPQQELRISLLSEHWLHEGSLVCPSCREVCQDEFESRGETCREGSLPPKTHDYHQDVVVCDHAKDLLPFPVFLHLAVAILILLA